MSKTDAATQQYDADDHDMVGSAPSALDQAPVPAPATSVMIALDDILERDLYTRHVHEDHVDHLVESIAAIGLEQPLVLITGNELVAGRHRYRALVKLRAQDRERFDHLFPGGAVPAQVFDLGPRPDPQDILALEVTENSARRDYTKEEMAVAVEALRSRGYSCKRGRPGKDDLPLVPALKKIFGMSNATVHRALSLMRGGGKPARASAPRATASAARGATVDETVSDEMVSSAVADRVADRPAGVDRMTAARRAVERLTDDEFEDFAVWFADHRGGRPG